MPVKAFNTMSVKTLFKNNHCEWIDVLSPTQEDLDWLHETYGINDLYLEDSVDTNHLPKFEQLDGVKFFLTRENVNSEKRSLSSISDVSTKVAIFLFKKYIITIHRLNTKSIVETYNEVESQEDKNDITADDIALMIGLKVIDSFDVEAQLLLDKADAMEIEIFTKNHNNDANLIKKLYRLKRKTALNSRVLNITSDWLGNYCKLNLDDVQVADLRDKYKDVTTDFDHLNSQITNLISMYLALSDQKANQVMKLLAMFSVYFLPITFIAGLYGMNFENMPELHYKYAYYGTLVLMACIVLITFIYFKKKKW